MILTAVLIAGCSETAATAEAAGKKKNSPSFKAVTGARIEDMKLDVVNEASGILQDTCDAAVIDYSNTADGYVMARFDEFTDKRIKVQVYGPEDTYTYNIAPGDWAVFPLSEGSGEYVVSIFENIDGTKYAQVLSSSFTAELKDEFSPFLRPNQYVNYTVAPNTVATADLITEGISDPLGRVKAVYDFVTGALKYDKELASTVESGYVPELDRVLESGKGICFDYAALMTGMLRYKGVPCKLVFGYVDDLYHAWISVWVEGEGWIDDVIHFDGTEWTLMDPTFASNSSAKDLKNFVGDGENYMAKFFY